MTKKILSFLLTIILLGQNLAVFADVDEQYDGTINQYNRSYENLLGEKVGFLVEGINSDGTIKRNEDGYLIDDFLKNDSVKNINSGFNGDFGNVRLETSSQANIASYFPSIFNWNIPDKVYELNNGNIVEGSGQDIYPEDEKDSLCTYGFTRSIDSDNDITTKVDVYGLSADGNKLIGKDTYNSTILKQIERLAGADNEKANEFIEAVQKNAILIEHDGKHEIYNYSNYGGNLKQSVMGPSMNNYSINSYLEKVENDLSSFDSEIRFSDINTNQTSELENGKYGNYISYDKSEDVEEHKYYIINKNNFVGDTGIVNLDISKLFIQYKDLINGLNEVDSEIISNIKLNYGKNLLLGIPSMVKADSNNLYEKGRIKNSLLLVDNYLSRLGVTIPSQYSSKLYNSEEYNSLEGVELAQVVGAYYIKFLSTLQLKFTTLHIDNEGNTKIIPQEGNFRTDWAIGTLDELSTNIGFHLYNTNGEDTEFSFGKTISYGDLGGSFGIFPKIKLESGEKVGFQMGFAIPGEPTEDIKRLYNSIIGGSDLAIEYIENTDYNYIYGLRDLLKESPYKSGKLSLKFLYNSAGTLDFFFKNDLNNAEVIEDKNFATLIALSFNYFNNGDSYNIRDISKNKLTTKHPYVFPVSYFIGKDEREYSYYSPSLKKLKDGETSYFKVCLGDNNIKKLLKATPESHAYTKKLSKNGKEYLLTYKVLEMQYKFAGELTMGSDFGFYGDMPPEESINLGNFMNNNPLKDISYKGEDLKIENFLSGKNINIWSGFVNRNTDKYSYGFRSFSKAGDNLMSYKENGASNRLYDTDSGHLFNPIVNTLKKIEGNNFGDGTGTPLIETGKKDTTLGAYNYTSDLYSTTSCPKGYDLYDDYKDIYAEINSKVTYENEKKEIVNKFPFLEKINYRKLNGIDYQAITGYFNTPRPFCIHSSLSKNKDTVMKSIIKMFVIDEGPDDLGPVDKYNYILQKNSNPFMYFDEEKGNFKFSTSYLNTLRSLFSSEYQRFPTYNKVSENLDQIYTGDSSKDILGYIDYSDKIDEIIDNLLLYNIKTTDEDGINFEARYNTQRAKLKNILSDLNKVYFSGIYGFNLLKNSNNDYEDFSNSSNADLFPIIGAVKTIKKAGIDFYCKDEDGIKTNSLILKGKCISKNTGDYADNEKLYINYGKELARGDGAFVNNTTLLPFFKPGISIKDTSGTLFLNKDVSTQEELPFIKDIVFNDNTDDINLKPRITALRGISSSEMIENQLNQGYGYRAGGFLYPYSKFLNSSNKKEFNNLLINSSYNLDTIQTCISIYDPTDETEIEEGSGLCPSGYFRGYKKGTFAPFIFNNGYSDTLGVKDSDYSILNVPLSFGDILINRDMESYSSSNILNDKAELVAGKSSILVYNGDYLQKNKGIDLLTGYVKSDKNPKYGDYMFLTIDNSSTGLNNNSVFYEIKSNFIPEACLFGDDNINACIEEYNTFDYTFVNRASLEDTVSEEKVCLELDGTDRVYLVGNENENDIDQTGYCNLSCLTVEGDEKIFSSNNYYLFTENQGDPVCEEAEPTKLKIIDGYSVNNFLEDNEKAVNLGKYYEKGDGVNGTGIPINSDLGTCYYNNDPTYEPLSCTKGYLSRYSNEINKEEGDLKENPGYRNSFNYSENLELGKKVSTNFNGVLNNDLIILTSNITPLGGIEQTIEGGYIGYNSSIIDNITGGIKEPYIFSDNDNLLGEGQTFNNSSLVNTHTKNGRQQRRDRIKDQLKLSAGTGNDLLTSPTRGLNYISYEINKDDFYSLNGVLRIAKDSTKYFTNIKLQNPENEGELLADVNVFDTIYSHNNLTIKYGNRFYTWGNNDTSCNGINPNEVYNKIDMYSGDKTTSREDTMTLCLSNKSNLSEEHDISNDIHILLPIKPTKGYNKYSINGNVENTNPSNDIIVNVNGVIKGDYSRRDNKFDLNTYFQGYFTNKYNSLDNGTNFLDIFDSGSSDYAVKGRYVRIWRESRRDRCDDEPDGRDYWYEGYTEYNANFHSNKVIINKIPKVLANSFITKQSNDKSIFVLPVNITKTNTNYSGSNGKKDLQRGSTRGYGCDSESDEKREARADAREAMTKNIEYYNQGVISFGSVNSNSTLTEYNKGNIVNSFYIPPVEDITNYSNNISYNSVIKDSYYKAGNLLNNLGLIKSNENYVKSSLEENDYKVNVGDYLDFEQTINVNGDITPQLMFLKTQLDRGLDIDISSLEFEKNGYKQYPIYVNDEETKEIVGNRYNTKYIVSRINSSSSNEKEVFTTGTNNKYNDVLSISKNNKITVTEGKLFLQVLSPTAKVYGTKGTKYWRGHTSDITLIFETNNGIIKEEDLSDIFTDLGTNLEAGDILTIGAGEYIRFSDNNVDLKVVGFNSLPEYLLNYDREKVMVDDQIVGIPFIESGFNNLEISPSKTQPYYVFRCDRLENEDKFRKSNTTIGFTDNIGAQYCGVYNKYSDNVFNGYLNAMSSYNRLVMPSEEYRFSYGDESDDNAKLLGQHAKYNNNSLSRTSRGYMNGDREKQLLVNLGIVKQGDVIKVKYKAKVNEFNDIGHILYNYNDIDSKSISIQNEDNDTLLGSIHSKNNDIYTKALNSQLLFFTHYGDEVNIFDKEQIFEDGSSIKSKLEITPNIDLSIINLSGRKGYVGCNPLNETTGKCDQFNSIETLNRDGEDNNSNGDVIKKDGDSQAILYKGQKFFLRTTITNNYIDKNSIDNTLRSLQLNLGYNSDLVLFDGVIVENSFNSDNNLLYNGLGEKTTVRPGDLDSDLSNVIDNRKEYIQEIKDSSIAKSYKQVDYNIDTSDFNSEGGVTVDYLFTMKNSLNADNIKELFGTAYLKDIGGIFLLNSEFTKNRNSEHEFPTNNGNTAYTESYDYEGSNSTTISNLFNNNGVGISKNNSNTKGSLSFQYFKMPFSDQYKFLIDDKNMITNLNPNLAVLNSRIINFGGDESGAYKGDSSDGRLALELTLSNTSNENIILSQDSLRFSLPNGFELDKIDYTSLDNSSKVSINLITEELYGTANNTTIKLDKDYGKKTYRLTQENDELIPGEKIQYLVYLNVDRNLVDLFSTFTANVDIIKDINMSTLFTDTGINIDKGLGDLSIKSMPIISENDAYFGAGFIKNKVTNQDLIENNNGESGYNIIAGNGSQLEYSGTNANNKVLDGSIQPQIFNITELTNEVINNYSIIMGDDLLSLSNIDFISSGNPHYLIKPDVSGNINLINNTLYYFGEYDVYIGEYDQDIDDLSFIADNNINKPNLAGITLFTKGSIEVNHNIYLYNDNSNGSINSINYIAFMGNRIEINPRVSYVEGTYTTPLTNNAYMEVEDDGTSINYSSSGNIGIIRPGYSNIPLSVNGNMVGGNIIRERTINEVIDGENITEKYEFDYKLYLAIPPVIRK